MSGQVYTLHTLPQQVTVLPQPRLRINYSHSQPDSSNRFYIEVSVTNQGYITASNFKIDLSQVTVLGDLDGNGRSLIFDLLQTTIDGQPVPTAYIFDFGDIAPDQRTVGRWEIKVRASDGMPLINPRITGFSVDCRHQPYKGLDLDSLIVGCGPVNQFFLTGDCPFCSIQELNLMVGGPINTGNGNYTYRQSTPSIPTVGDPLQLIWTYNSLNSGAFSDLSVRGSPLGIGWTHNYNLQLDLSQSDQVTFQAAHGSPFIFERVRDAFEPVPGVWGTLTRTEVITNQYVYTLTAVNQAVYSFDNDGRLTQQRDPQGNDLTFSYDAQNRLSQIMEPVSNRYLTLDYDAQGQLLTVTDPISRETRFGYTTLTNSQGITWSVLTSVTDTRQQLWDYDYTELIGGEYILARVTDPDSKLIEATAFDDLGRAISQTYRGETLAITYYDDGRRAITDGLGRVMTHTYNSQSQLIGQTDAEGEEIAYTLDSNANRTFAQDKNGNPTYYEKTAFGRTTAITDALGHVTRFEYDANNNLTASTDALGRTTTYLYDNQNNLLETTNALSHTTRYTYNANGQTTSVTDENSNITRYGYDAIGQRTVITDALGHVTRYEYDAVGRLVRTIDAKGKITLNEYDGGNNMIRVTENYLAGQPQNHQNEYNLVTTYTYDGTGRRVTTTDTLGRVDRTEYDTAGRLWRSIKNEHPTVTTQNYLNQYNLITEFGYDVAGNLNSVTDTLGRETRTEFDARNRIDRIIVNYVDGVYDPAQPDEDITTRYVYDANGNQQSVFDTLNRETRSEYDELNRLSRTIANYQDGIYDPAEPDEDLIIRYEYDEVGNQKKVIDPLGRATDYSYDALNRVEIVTNPLSGTISYAYDAVGNQTGLTDPENRTTTYGYDALNRVVTMTNALNGIVTTAYDEVGNQLTQIDANGNLTRFGYDSLYRQTVITNALENVTGYSYDAVGRVVELSDALGQVTRTEYDNNDNIILITQNYLAGQPQNYQNEYNVITAYAYDPLKQQTVMTDTLGRVTRQNYDQGSRVVEQIVNYVDGVYNPAQPDEDIITRYIYDGNSNIIGEIDALGRERRTEYDGIYRITRQISNYVDGVYNPAQPDEDIVTSYSYDGVGNQVSTIDTLGRETRAAYDALNRIERTIINYQNGVFSAAQPDEDLINAYTYDQVGNVKTISDPLNRVTDYSYDALNRVLAITNPLSGTTSYTYDDVGNQLSLTDARNQLTTYDYDALNRVVTTTNALNGQTVIVYDAVGNQQQVTNPNGQTTQYTYDTLYRLTESLDAELQRMSYSYDAASNTLSITDPENRVTSYVYDDLNRVVQTTNALSGTSIVTYDALGNRLSSTDENNHTTNYEYDDLNRLVQTTDPNNLVTQMIYDGLGNRRFVTNGANETSEFQYDGINRLVKSIDPLNNETMYRYDGASNRTAMVDAEGIEARYNYDNLDRLEQMTENYVDGTYTSGITDEDVITQYEYDPVGNRIMITDARNNSTTQVYDNLNRLTEIQDPLNNITRYGYDAIGNRTVMTDANGIVTSFSYDNVNQMETINYPTGTPDVTFTYDQAGNQKTMADGTGTTTYSYDSLYRLTSVNDGANLQVGYGYDAVGNRTRLTYPNNYTVTYTYDPGNRLNTVTDWNNGQFGYNYDDANRLSGLSLPNGVSSSYNYDRAGRLTLLTHQLPITNNQLLASYDYALDRVGNRRVLTETIAAVQELSGGAFLEENGLVVGEAEHFSERTNGPTHQWNLKTTQSGYTGTSYLQSLPDIDRLYQTDVLTDSPRVSYPLNFTTPGTYTLWLRGYATSATGDSAYIDLNNQVIAITGFAPRAWTWANSATDGQPATVVVTNTGVYTLELLTREDGLNLDRFLLTTDTTYLPVDFGPVESPRLTGTTTLDLTIDRVITYGYDDLYRLLNADYSTGEAYTYEYDPVGNRLKQIIDGDTTDYLYDAANRLAQVTDQSSIINYQYDANGNLLNTDAMTNTWDAANRLTQSQRAGAALESIYNGINHRVGQTKGSTTTHLALDAAINLPEVIYTSEGHAYLHLPGVIMAESSSNELRYLLSDGLGSVRQAVNENAEVTAYHEFDPYGKPIPHSSFTAAPFAFTGEWWAEDIQLLHLRARWYQPDTGRFLNRDPLFNTPQYSYASGNPVNRVDPSGLIDWDSCVKHNSIATCHLEFNDTIWGIAREALAFQGLGSDDPTVPHKIASEMAPHLWDLNPHLHSPELWHCPACAKNPTVSSATPFGTINVPASWLPVAPPPSPTPSPTPTQPDPFSPPPIVTPTPPIQPDPQPVSLREIVQTLWNKYQDGEDGIIFGGGIALNSIIMPIADWSGYTTDGPELEANGICLPATGVTGGLEVVYDFKHQERGLFQYDGPTLNIGSLASIGLTGYIGKTRGFATQGDVDDPGGYKAGVTAYRGYSASVDINAGNPTLPIIPGPGLNVNYINGVPLTDEKMFNPDGVFATYYGIGGGISSSYFVVPLQSGIPINIDSAVTDYSIINAFPFRLRYGLPFGGAGAEQYLKDPSVYQKAIYPNRIIAAKAMETEIRMLGGQGIPGTQTLGSYLGFANPIPIGRLVNHAVSELWDFVYRP